MKSKSVILLAVAIGCGLVAMLGVQKFVSAPKEEPRNTVQVLVAAADISPGERLTSENTKFKETPADAVPEGVITTPEEFEDRSLRFGAVANDVILKAKLTEKGQSGVAVQIPPGMRVVTVKVSDTKTHSGLIRPGNFVDVVLTYDARHRILGNIKKTKTVLQNIRVFATDSITKSKIDHGGQEIKAKNISVLVTPRQGNILMLAENKGSLTLALRGDGDNVQSHAREVDESQLDWAVAGGGGSVAPTKNKSKSGSDLKDFLDGGNTGANKDAQGKPKWTITVFEGNQARLEEIEVDEKLAEPPVEKPEVNADEAGTRPTAVGKPDGKRKMTIADWIMRSFASKPKGS